MARVVLMRWSGSAALPGTRVPTLSETTPEAVTVRELPARAVSG